MSAYKQGFRARMVERMLGAEGISPYTLAKETGVNRGTLIRWLEDARILDPMGSKKQERHQIRKPARSRSGEEKYRLMTSATSLSGEEFGAFLRTEGLHEAEIEEWRSMTIALLDHSSRKNLASPESKLVRELQQELLRKDRALAEFAALLALKKKVQEIWGDVDEHTPSRKGT